MGKKVKFYVVWEGRNTGVFTSWDECAASVFGFQGAKYKSFGSYEEAAEAFLHNPSGYIKKKVTSSSNFKLPKIPRPTGKALTVDAACKGNPGIMEYRGVWLHSGEEYFRMGPYAEGTVNIGEFLAVVHGLAQLKRDGYLTVPIYSDSNTALKWVRDKKANTKLVVSHVNSKLFEYISRAEYWLTVNEYQNRVLKWQTDIWGEIPADYGRK